MISTLPACPIRRESVWPSDGERVRLERQPGEVGHDGRSAALLRSRVAPARGSSESAQLADHGVTPATRSTAARRSSGKAAHAETSASKRGSVESIRRPRPSASWPRPGRFFGTRERRRNGHGNGHRLRRLLRTLGTRESRIGLGGAMNVGGEGGTRTPTGFRPSDFKSDASTGSATSPRDREDAAVERSCPRRPAPSRESRRRQTCRITASAGKRTFARAA
jgi:hypothetical protein